MIFFPEPYFHSAGVQSTAPVAFILSAFSLYKLGVLASWCLERKCPGGLAAVMAWQV